MEITSEYESFLKANLAYVVDDFFLFSESFEEGLLFLVCKFLLLVNKFHRMVFP